MHLLQQGPVSCFCRNGVADTQDLGTQIFLHSSWKADFQDRGVGRLVLSSSEVSSSRFWDLLVTWRHIPISASVT